MVSTPDSIGASLLLPAKRFYWAVLEPGALTSADSSTVMRLTRIQLGYLFENVLPVQLESVHAVYVPLEDGRVLACGIAEDELIRSIDESALHFGPDQLPAFIRNQGVTVDPQSINLLTGHHTPRVINQLHRRWFVGMAAILILLTGLILGGMERRVRAYGEEGNALRQQAHEVMTGILGPGSTGLVSQQPTEILFTAELRRLRQTRRANPEGEGTALAEGADAGYRLSDLFARWPAAMFLETESISLSGSHLTVTAIVPSVAEANEFARTLEGLEGWRMNQPEMTNTRDRVRVTVRFGSLIGEGGS